MLVPDRLLAAFHALIKSALPRIDYLALYSAKVIVQSGDLFDLAPDDPRLPSMGGIPIRHGLPGVTVRVPRDSTVLVGWENGDPSRPFCCLWQGGEGNVTRITVAADQITLGSEAGAEPTLKGATYRAAEDTYLDALATGVNAALSALGLVPAANTLAAAQLAFKAAAPGFQTTKVRVV